MRDLQVTESIPLKSRRPKSARIDPRKADKPEQLIISGAMLQKYTELTFRHFVKDTLRQIQSEKDTGEFVKNLKFDRWGNLRTNASAKKEKRHRRAKTRAEFSTPKEDCVYQFYKSMPRKDRHLDKRRLMLERYQEMFKAEEDYKNKWTKEKEELYLQYKDHMRA